MRLFLLAILTSFAVSAQAFERTVTIEGEFRRSGQAARTVFQAFKIKLEISGYGCKAVYGILEIPCNVTHTDVDSLTDSRTRIRINDLYFGVLYRSAAQNKQITKKDRAQFEKNIRDYEMNNDTLTNQDPVDFYLDEKIVQSLPFSSYNHSSQSVIRVTQH